MKYALVFGLAVALGGPALAADRYVLDPSHSQVVFSYNHLGFSTTWGMYSGFEGEIVFDEAEPANSSVVVEMPVDTMITGWDKRTAHFLSDDFFKVSAHPLVRFESTGIEVTGENTAKITGDLTMNGYTNAIVLDAQLNQLAVHPMANKPWAGFSATTTVLRSDFGLGMFAPNVSDEVDLEISIEAMKAEG